MPSLIRMMLTDSQGGNIAWALVYQISLDDRGRILISRSECFSFVLEYLLRCKEIPLPSIPLALAVNLAHVPKLATEISQVSATIRYKIRRFNEIPPRLPPRANILSCS